MTFQKLSDRECYLALLTKADIQSFDPTGAQIAIQWSHHCAGSVLDEIEFFQQILVANYQCAA
jgi:hypothetical protein